MAVITIDLVLTNTPGPIWVFIIGAILITWLSIKAWKKKARERRLKWQQEDRFKA